MEEKECNSCIFCVNDNCIRKVRNSNLQEQVCEHFVDRINSWAFDRNFDDLMDMLMK